MEPMFSKKELRDLIIPLVLEQILAVTIGLADTMMVSSVGEAAVAGISGVDAINVLLINVFSALATGGAVVASQYLGRGDRENACSAAKQLIHSGALLSGVLGLLSLCFARYVLGAQGLFHVVYAFLKRQDLFRKRGIFILEGLDALRQR